MTTEGFFSRVERTIWRAFGRQVTILGALAIDARVAAAEAIVVWEDGHRVATHRYVDATPTGELFQGEYFETDGWSQPSRDEARNKAWKSFMYRSGLYALED